jgi:S-formylglutathione hydrolase FrmB
VTRSRLAGLVVGVALVAYIPAVAVWAVADGGSTPSARSTAAPTTKGSQPSASASATRGTRQVLHVVVPGTHTARDVIVYRPPVPDSATLPVLYILHGYPGSADDPFDAGLPHIIDQLVAAGYPPFVLAAPDGTGTKHPDTEWANAVDGTDQFETFVTRNVIDAVEGTNRRDRSRRAIAGFSMGAYGAVNLALRHPDLYGQVVPLAGYFHVDDPSGVFGHQLAAIDANTPELHLANARRERILVVDGDQGNDRVVNGESQLFVQELVAAHVPASYEQIPGDHSWTFVAAAFPDVGRFLDAQWSTLRPPPPEPAPQDRTEASGRWRGSVTGTQVDVSLLSAGDPRVKSLESARAELGAAPASYVRVTLHVPASATAPFVLTQVSLVDTTGLTVEANPAPAVLEEWLGAAREPRRVREARPDGTPRDSPSAPVVAGVHELEREMAGQTVAAPGQTTSALLVTTGVVRNVGLLFVGDSFADGTLSRVG